MTRRNSCVGVCVFGIGSYVDGGALDLIHFETPPRRGVTRNAQLGWLALGIGRSFGFFGRFPGHALEGPPARSVRDPPDLARPRNFGRDPGSGAASARAALLRAGLGNASRSASRGVSSQRSRFGAAQSDVCSPFGAGAYEVRIEPSKAVELLTRPSAPALALVATGSVGMPTSVGK